MTYDLGVDLGTTFVAAAIARDNRVEMVTLGNRSVVTPAVVYLSPNAELLFGDSADRQAISHPDRVVREFKRRLGDPTPVVLAGVPHQVTALMGAMLRDVLARVGAVEGGPPNRVALTHPANWGPYRRELFEEIPQLAGLNGHHTFTEPEAAAAYYATARDLDDGDTIAVYDLGGGTFDATVLRKRGNNIELLGAPEGIERLGGIDFDEAILQWINYTNDGVLAELDLSDPAAAAALAKLRQDCVLAKEALSADDETTIPVLLPHQHFQVTLTRTAFEGMIRAPIESTIGTLLRVLYNAQVDARDLSAVLLVGGSSRIPLIARMISQELGRPTLVDAHPKHAVALGAATIAAGRPVPQTWAPPRPLPTSTNGSSTNGPSTNGSSNNGSSNSGSSNNGPGDSGAGDSGSPKGPGNDSADGTPATGGGQNVGRPAAAGPPPAPPGPAPVRIAQPRPFNRPLVLGLAAGALAIGAIAGAVVVLNQHDDAQPAAAVASRTTANGSDAVAATPRVVTLPAATTAAATKIALAAAVPALGATINLAQNPNFAVASPSGRQLYIANADAKEVTVLDTSVNEVTATIPVAAGPPQFLAFSPDGRFVYISIWDKQFGKIAAVSVLDTSDNRITGTIKVRTRPFLGAVTQNGKSLWVPNHDSGTLSLVDTATRKVTKEIKVAPNPHWAAFSTDGKWCYTADHESNMISVINVATGKVVHNIRVGKSPHSLAVNPKRPLVANVNYDGDSVTVINTRSNKVVKTIRIGRNPQNIAWSPDGRFAYAVNNVGNSVSVISADRLKVTATIPTGKSPTSIAVLPDGSKGYVSNLDGSSLTLINLATP